MPAQISRVALTPLRRDQETDQVLDDPRAEALRQTYVRERERSEEMEFERYEDSLYERWP
jgi:hypothetical protein